MNSDRDVFAESMPRWTISGPAKATSAADRIIDDFRDQILGGKMARGTRLPTEKELCAAYGVSSVTVRAAMRALATANLIQVRQGSGSYVTAQRDVLVTDSLRSMIQVERITAPEIMLVLGGLNGSAAELAAANASMQEIQQMEAALDDIDQTRTMHDRAERTKYFLDLLGRASGSLLLASLCRFFSGLQVDLTARSWDGSIERWRRIAQPLSAERRRLVACIKERDARGARDAAVRYHVHARKLILKLQSSSQTPSNPLLVSLLSSVPKEPTLTASPKARAKTSAGAKGKH